MLSLVLGFLAPFIPDLITAGKTMLDQRHEKEMLKLTLEGQDRAASWRMEEVKIKADGDAFVTAHKSPPSFGVKLLDASKTSEGKLPWYLVPVLYLFAFVDFLNAVIRPSITIWFLGFYLASKWARVQLAVDALHGSPEAGWQIWANALTAVWDETDREILMVIVGFWFGKISRSAAHGKL